MIDFPQPELVWPLQRGDSCQAIYDRKTAVLLTRPTRSTSQVERFNLLTGQRQVLGDSNGVLTQLDRNLRFFMQQSGNSLNVHSLPSGEIILKIPRTSHLVEPRLSPNLEFLVSMADENTIEIRRPIERVDVVRVSVSNASDFDFGKHNLLRVFKSDSPTPDVISLLTGEIATDAWQESVEPEITQSYRQNQNYELVRQQSFKEGLNEIPSVWDVVKSSGRGNAIRFYNWISGDYYMEYLNDQLVHKSSGRVVATFDESYSSWVFARDQSCLGRHSNVLGDVGQLEIYQLPPAFPSSQLIWLSMLSLPVATAVGRFVIKWWFWRNAKSKH